MNAAADDKGSVLILAFGDSLTAGWGVPVGSSYPDVVANLFAEDGMNVRMVNAGVSGDTTSGGRSRLSWVLAGMDRAPDVAVVELGANDMLMGLDVERAEENLDAILTELKATGALVLLTGMRAMPNLGPEYGVGFDAIYQRLAERHQVPLYPFFLEGVAGEPELNQADGIHPNEEGTRLIAEKVYPHIKKLVQAVR